MGSRTRFTSILHFLSFWTQPKKREDFAEVFHMAVNFHALFSSSLFWDGGVRLSIMTVRKSNSRCIVYVTISCNLNCT
jgi:hypothetical protein